MIDMQTALQNVYNANIALLEVWDEDQVKQYPSYLPSFDEFIVDLMALLEEPDSGVREFAILADYGCAVWVQDGYLFDAPMLVDGSIEWNEDSCGEVTAPETQEFLDQVNAALKTNYQMEQFAGR